MSEHEAGRELDALVAEKVMGLGPAVNYPGSAYYDGPGERGHYRGPGNLLITIPCYSTDIAAAWDVWLKITSEPHAEHWAIYSYADGAVAVEYYGDGYSGDRESGAGNWRVEADSAPLAICRAALQAVAPA